MHRAEGPPDGEVWVVIGEARPPIPDLLHQQRFQPIFVGLEATLVRLDDHPLRSDLGGALEGVCVQLPDLAIVVVLR